MTGWQPIDTAPKDGTVIDLWMIDQDGDGWRVPNAWFVRDLDFDYLEYREDGSYRQVAYKRDGWFADNHDYDGQSGWCDLPRHYNPHPMQKRWLFQEPTHWMPLPDPPA